MAWTSTNRSTIRKLSWLLAHILMFVGIALSTYGAHALETPEHEVIVFGDSLTSVPNSWLEKTRDQYPGVQIRNYARAGMVMTDLNVPKWTRCGYNTTVVIWLGGNDAIGILDPFRHNGYLKDALRMLHTRRCKTVMILPPALPSHASATALAKVRSLQRGVVRTWAPWVKIFDPPFYESMTLDGVHQTDELHQLQADWFYREVLTP